MTLIIDIDDTLLKSESNDCICGSKVYKRTKAIQDEINLLNTFYKNGFRIILFTGRGWQHYDITVEQLKRHNIKYNELIMGKPLGIYVDKDSIKSLKEIKNYIEK
jgi:hydroxymethylpyrimidine pyrophosphatase-like HAD family hydrolase